MIATNPPSLHAGMVSVDHARALILARARRTTPERVALDDALARVLAAPIVAARDQPPFHGSAMDGYALRAADTPGFLRVIGDSAAGRAFAGALPPGCAVRISTGAPLPAGADAILVQEEACVRNGTLRIDRRIAHRHVRQRAADFAAGAPLLKAGTHIGVGEIALAAGAGYAHLAVARAPRVAIIAGGDEIVAPGAAPSAAQMFDSASYAIAALIRAWGGAPIRQPLVRDCRHALAAAMTSARAQNDVVIVIGGASIGRHDHARAAAASLNAHLLFEKIAAKPGKPTWCAHADGALILGLPGNGAAALICARLFLAPLLQAMLGCSSIDSIATSRAVSTHPIAAGAAYETFLRARVHSSGADARMEVIENQDTASLVSLAACNALVVRPPNCPALDAGEAADHLRWTP